MNFFGFIYRNGVWISIPVLVIAVVMLVFFIKSVIRMKAEKTIMSIPAVEQQDVEFTEAGNVVLCIEGPLLTTRFGGVKYELIASDGSPVKGHVTLFHSRSSSFTKIRMEMKSFELPYPGRYTIKLINFGPPKPKDGEHRIVFMKPNLAQAVGYILGIVFSGILFIGSIVLFLMCLFLKEGSG